MAMLFKTGLALTMNLHIVFVSVCLHFHLFQKCISCEFYVNLELSKPALEQAIQYYIEIYKSKLVYAVCTPPKIYFVSKIINM